MRFIADLHIHSRFSRATSKDLTPETLSAWAQKKGIAVLGTGDFTHPEWLSELMDKLVEQKQGLYGFKKNIGTSANIHVPGSCASPILFLLSGEISCVYKKNGRVRKLHHLILMPDFDSAIRLNKRLGQIGNIVSDGRPILGLDSRDLLEIVLEADERAFFIPAHIWTPWFSLFGSKSGFDTIEECFEDLTNHIQALETGLSSDPPMNRLLSDLDKYTLISNSDAHSPGKLGREANLFNTDMDYDSMIRAMTTGNGFDGTIEFFPEEGKYHLDGHRKCNIRFQPTETEQVNNLCPVCGKAMTVGVLNRVHALSDRNTPKHFKDFFSLIPLCEILSQVLGVGPSSKKVMTFYENLLLKLGPELNILRNVAIDDIKTVGGHLLAEAVKRMRQNKVRCEGGYDGEYGTIHLFDRSEKNNRSGQMSLFETKPAKSLLSNNKA
jgi:DNA helicase-2/ATP-dependent DNA helicase PcrA